MGVVDEFDVIEARNAARAAAIARCEAAAERFRTLARRRVCDLDYGSALAADTAGRERVCREIDTEIGRLAAEVPTAVLPAPVARRADGRAGGLSLQDMARVGGPVALSVAIPLAARVGAVEAAGAGVAAASGPVGWVAAGGFAL